MICNALDQSGTPHQNACGNRITYSALKDYELFDYAASTYSIKYVIRGTEQYVIDKKRIRVGAGNFIIVNSDTSIDGLVKSRHAVEGFCIHLEKELLADILCYSTQAERALLDDASSKPAVSSFRPLLHSDKDSRLGRLLASFTGKFDRKTNALSIAEEEVYEQLGELLISLHGLITNPKERLKVTKQSTREELLRRLMIAKEIMDMGLDKHLDVPGIASRAMLSVTHFNRTFRDVYHISPYHYLLRKRMEKARKILKNEDASVGTIALECGYNDPVVFSKAFKKVYGIAPAQVR